MFAVIFNWGNLLLRIAGKIAKIRTRKKFRATRYIPNSIKVALTIGHGNSTAYK